MNSPAGGIWRLCNGVEPLSSTGFFSDVDLLAATHETDHNRPFWDAFSKLDEVIGLALSCGTVVVMLSSDLLLVPCSLGLIKDQDML